MGYWIHVEDLPTGGGGSGPDWGGCLGCLGFLAVVFFLWYINAEYGLMNALIAIVARGLLLAAVASVGGIIYILKETDLERNVIIAGCVGFAAAAIFFGVYGFGFPGAFVLAPIGAVAVMFLYVISF